MREHKHTGLDALAALCGGASRVSSSPPNNDKIDNAGHWDRSTNMNGNQSTIINTQHPVATATNSPLNYDSSQQQQWYQAFMNAAACGGMNPLTNLSNTGISSIIDSNPAMAANAVQQIAFYSAFQAASVAQASQLAMISPQQHVRNEGNPSMIGAPLPSPVPSQVPYGRIDSNSLDSTRIVAPAQPVIPDLPAGMFKKSGRPIKCEPNSIERTTNSVISTSSNFHCSKVQKQASYKKEGKHRSFTAQDVQGVTNVNVSGCFNRKKAPSRTTQSQRKPKPKPVIDTKDHYHQLSDDDSNDKKVLKRAANRRSAQLSRKRKKVFIEELKDANDDLRRKEQILSNMPDLVIAFDLGGKILFISNSSQKFLGFSPRELKNTSFWDRLCADSVRLLKAAFMDALVARKPGLDMITLGDGLWEVQLISRNGESMIVSLNGVVHFEGENPECVCSIRPINPRPSNKVSGFSKVSLSGVSKVSFSEDNSSVGVHSSKATPKLCLNDVTPVEFKGQRRKSREKINIPKVSFVSDVESILSESNSR